ncbi:MAG: hypothetical protein LBS92_06995 [Candidatus Methanoplasma sp.]|nr:hypothetical protein [Candidatus Methanoplasma sp.]
MRSDKKAVSTVAIAVAIVALLAVGAGIYYISTNGSDDSEVIDDTDYGVGTYFDYSISGKSSGRPLSGTYKIEIVGISADNTLRYMTYDIYMTVGGGKTPLMQDSEYDLMTPEKAAEIDMKEVGTETIDTAYGKQKVTVFQYEEDGGVSKMYVGSNGVPYRQSQTHVSADMDFVMDLKDYLVIETEPAEDPEPIGSVFEYSIEARYGSDTYEGSMGLSYVAYDDSGYWVQGTTSILGQNEMDFTHHDWSEGNDGYVDTGATAVLSTVDGDKTLSIAEDVNGNRIYGDADSGMVYRMIITEDGVRMTMDLTYYKTGNRTGGTQNGGDDNVGLS